MGTERFCDRCGLRTVYLDKISVDTIGEFIHSNTRFREKDFDIMAKEVGSFSRSFELCAKCYLGLVNFLLNKNTIQEKREQGGEK